MILGKTLAEIEQITAEQVSQALGGLPPATKHASQLAEDALDALIDRLEPSGAAWRARRS
jgi:NifU-like protein involved in Fe-S cluster formation